MKRETVLDSHKQKGMRKNYDPVGHVAAFPFGFASGGASMADFERLNDEAVPEDQTFPRRNDFGGMDAIRHRPGRSGSTVALEPGVYRLALPKIAKTRLLLCDELELFFDDTQLEVTGKQFEGSAKAP